MKREWKAVAVAVAVAIAAAIVAAMLGRSMEAGRKTADAEIFGNKVLEMLFCVPGTDCGAKQSTPFSGAGASAALPATSSDKEAT